MERKHRGRQGTRTGRVCRVENWHQQEQAGMIAGSENTVKNKNDI
jgi:hypothetical protein